MIVMKTENANVPTLADDLIEALGEAVAHAKGEIDLPTRIYTPPAIDEAISRPKKIARP